MSEVLHAPLPWSVDLTTGEKVVDASGRVVVDCGGQPIIPREWAQANAALIVVAVTERVLELTALTAAIQALRSYQYGNTAPDLAKTVADACAAKVAQMGARL